MIRTQVSQEWNALKVKFNQLSQWKQVFPNENANQVQTRINTLQNSYNTANELVNQKNTQIISLNSQVSTWQSNYNSVNSQLTTTRNELEKDRKWCDKWINDGQAFIKIDTYDRICDVCNKIGDVVIWPSDNRKSTFKEFSGRDSPFKEMFKTKVYQYYRDR